MPRAEKPVDARHGQLAEFARELRALRLRAGNPPYRSLARRAGFSASTLSVAASGRILPSLDVTLAYAESCGGDPAVWTRRWRALADQLEQLGQLEQLDQPASEDTDRLRAAHAVAAPVPQQLPRGVQTLVGRARELACLDALLASDDAAGARVCVVAGAGGMGKTALTVSWAGRHARRFPDGQLYANLRGHDVSDRPRTVGEVLHGFLTALGVHPGSIPDGEAERGALFRGLMARRRALLVLDDAVDSDQVSALLPGSRSCAVLITSRRRLEGLVASHGALLLKLDPLLDEDAASLLALHTDRGRLAREPDSTAQLLAWCAGLPLALAVTAARIAAHPEFPVSDLAEELRDEAARLDALESADHTTSLRTVLHCSRRALRPAAGEAFAMLGLVPGTEIGLPAAVALLGQSAARTRQLLRELESANMLSRPHPGRYRMHDLVRLYATESADDELTQAVRDRARRRLLDHYLHTARAGELALRPFSEELPIAPPVDGSSPESPEGSAGSLAWFEAEHACLLALHRSLAAHGPAEACWQLAWAMETFQYRRALQSASLEVWGAALTAAEEVCDDTAQGLAHRYIGRTLSSLGRHAEALAHLHRALAAATLTADPAARAHTEINLAWATELAGDEEAALDHSRRALDAFRELGDTMREAVALNAVGWYHTQLGRHAEAEACCRAALALHREYGNRAAEASTLDSLGRIAYYLGRHEEAADRYHETIALYRELGNEYSEADTMVRLGEADELCGRLDEAIAAWGWAYDLYVVQHRTEDAERVAAMLSRARDRLLD